MSWVIIVNRKHVSFQVCGPFDDEYTAHLVERQLAREVWVKTTDVVPVTELGTDDAGHLVRTAYI